MQGTVRPEPPARQHFRDAPFTYDQERPVKNLDFWNDSFEALPKITRAMHTRRLLSFTVQR